MKPIAYLAAVFIVSYFAGVATMFFYPGAVFTVASKIFPDTIKLSEAQILSLEPRPLAPAVPFKASGDISTTFERSKGQVRVVNFWATWCAPCIVEMPSLNRLAGEMASQGVVFMAISVDDKSGTDAETFLKKRRWQNLKFYADAGKQLHKSFYKIGIPVSYILDKKNRVAGVIEGSTDWNDASVRQFLERLISENS